LGKFDTCRLERRLNPHNAIIEPCGDLKTLRSWSS